MIQKSMGLVVSQWNFIYINNYGPVAHSLPTSALGEKGKEQ